jgi:hypothetical protein
VAARSVELLGHRVDLLGQAAELVVGNVLRVDLPDRSPAAILPAVVSIAASGRVMRRARYAAISAATTRARIAAASTAPLLSPNGRLLTWSASTTLA